ncbi:MAG: WD40 repeat domain-containing protein [Promethearchaeota archaeon]
MATRKYLLYMLFIIILLCHYLSFDSHYYEVYNDSSLATDSELRLSYLKNAPLWFYETNDTVRSVVISSDGNYILAGCDNFNLYYFETTNPIPLWVYRTNSEVSFVDISSNGEYCVATCQDILYLFHRSSSTPIWNYSAEDLGEVSISSSGEYIAASVGRWGGAYGEVLCFHRTNSTPLWIYNASEAILSVQISLSGEFIAAGGFDSGLYFFNNTNSTPVWNYNMEDAIRDIALSSDGRYLAAKDGKNLYFFDTSNSSPSWILLAFRNYKGLAISADGRYICSSIGFTTQEKVCLFESTSKFPIWCYGGVGRSIAMSFDGTYIIAAPGNLFSKGGSIPIWTTTHASSKVSISSDGNYIVTSATMDYIGIHLYSLIPLFYVYPISYGNSYFLFFVISIIFLIFIVIKRLKLNNHNISVHSY